VQIIVEDDLEKFVMVVLSVEGKRGNLLVLDSMCYNPLSGDLNCQKYVVNFCTFYNRGRRIILCLARKLNDYAFSDGVTNHTLSDDVTNNHVLARKLNDYALSDGVENHTLNDGVENHTLNALDGGVKNHTLNALDGGALDCVKNHTLSALDGGVENHTLNAGNNLRFRLTKGLKRALSDKRALSNKRVISSKRTLLELP